MVPMRLISVIVMVTVGAMLCATTGVTATFAMPDLATCSNYSVHTNVIRVPVSTTVITLTTDGLVGAESTMYTSSNPQPFDPDRDISPTSAACFNATVAAIDAAFAAPCDFTPANSYAQTYSGGGLRCMNGAIWGAGTHTLDGLGDPNAVFAFRAISLTFNAIQMVFVNGASAARTFFFSNGPIVTAVLATTNAQISGTMVARTYASYMRVTLTGPLLSLPDPTGAKYVKFDGTYPITL